MRTLSWFVGETGSRVSRIRAASRNEVRAPNSACTRSSSGVQRAVSSVQTGENVLASIMGANGRQRHTLNRGASTSTVPNRVCSRRVRRSLRGCSIPHAAQARWWAAYSATWPHSMLACSFASSTLVSSSMRPISANVLTNAGRPNVTNSVVFTLPALVIVSSRTVHCITPVALMLRHQPGRSAQDRQAGCPRFLTLSSMA
jgi:hypothetical protein